MISLIKNAIPNSDIDALIEWLKTYPRLSKGKLTIEFEEKWSKWLGMNYSVFVNSGSSANLLMIAALKEIGLTNNKIILPALSWATTVSPAIQLGLDPILCDTDKDCLGMDIDHLTELIIENHPSVVMVANILGFPNKFNRILELCKRYGCILIEDSCETVGSTYQDKMVGTFGLMSSFSFYFGHHISTIEGGMISTNDEKIFEVLKMLRSHGWDRDISPDTQKNIRKEYGISDFESLYTFYIPAFNLRSTDFQAFIGLRQIDRLSNIVTLRHLNFKYFQENIKSNYWSPNPDGKIISNFAYPILSERRSSLVRALDENGIECRPLVCGSMARQPFFRTRFPGNHCPFAERISYDGLYIPNNPDLTMQELETICKVVNDNL